MGRSEDLAAKAAEMRLRRQQQPAAQSAPPQPTPATGGGGERLVRLSVNVPPEVHAELGAWSLALGPEFGVSRVTNQKILLALVTMALSDPELQADVAAHLHQQQRAGE